MGAGWGAGREGGRASPHRRLQPFISSAGFAEMGRRIPSPLRAAGETSRKLSVPFGNEPFSDD